ncbi:MAG: type II toxin-antitoxin system HicB family antitoxin [Candidatus Aminicenantes bacterium]|nr:type II toxin-antitoxin system HicB family antitoxin [Candidatus Aminicenantes bacterium]
MKKHAVSIKWSDEDNGFIATIPGVEALSAFGDTAEKALSELKIAAEAYFESLKRAGKPIPLENKVISYSGQIRLRMSKRLHAVLSSEAEEEGVSLNTYMVTLLSERHIEQNLLKKFSDLEKMLKSINFSVESDDYSSSRQIGSVEEKMKRYRCKKKQGTL